MSMPSRDVRQVLQQVSSFAAAALENLFGFGMLWLPQVKLQTQKNCNFASQGEQLQLDQVVASSSE